MSAPTPVTEAEVRKLRANVYGETNDHAWYAVCENWSKPENVRWLRDQWQNKQRVSDEAWAMT